MTRDEVKQLGFTDEQINLYLGEPKSRPIRVYETVTIKKISKSGEIKIKEKRRFKGWEKEYYFDGELVENIITHLNGYTTVHIGA